MKFKLVLMSLIFLEIISCYFSYYTLGEVRQLVYIFILCLNIIPLGFYYFKFNITALFIVLIIGVVLIPYQTFLINKWFKLKRESLTIIEHVYSYEKVNGKFPKNIDGYVYINHSLSNNFSYHKNKNGFGLHYYVGTKGTTHFYYHNVGEWEYYPD